MDKDPICIESGRGTVSSQLTGTDEGAAAEFGANEWLVDELYERYQADKNSVDRSWWPVLESYHPVETHAVEGIPAEQSINPPGVPEGPGVEPSTPSEPVGPSEPNPSYPS